MKSPSIHLKRRLATLAGIAALLVLTPAAGASAASTSRQVQALDDCDAATFNAVLGAGTCVKDGTTTFSEFVAQLLAQGRAPAWRFAPGHLRLDAGGTLAAHNRGGEDHTFTEVADFGGGFAATTVSPGDTVTTSPLSPGIHRFECLIHPWMQTTVTVG